VGYKWVTKPYYFGHKTALFEPVFYSEVGSYRGRSDFSHPTHPHTEHLLYIPIYIQFCSVTEHEIRWRQKIYEKIYRKIAAPELSAAPTSMGPVQVLHISPRELHSAQPQMFNDFLGAQPCIVRGPLAPQPAAQGEMDYALDFAVVHGGEDCRLVGLGFKEHNKNFQGLDTVTMLV
jgi:hypothetical protein